MSNESATIRVVGKHGAAVQKKSRRDVVLPAVGLAMSALGFVGLATMAAFMASGISQGNSAAWLFLLIAFAGLLICLALGLQMGFRLYEAIKGPVDTPPPPPVSRYIGRRVKR